LRLRLSLIQAVPWASSLEGQFIFKRALLVLKPGENILAPAFRQLRPMRHTSYIVFLAYVPEFLDDHEVPASFSLTRQSKDLDGEAMPRPVETMALMLTGDTINDPARLFNAGVRRAQQHVEHPEKGWAGEGFYDAILSRKAGVLNHAQSILANLLPRLSNHFANNHLPRRLTAGAFRAMRGRSACDVKGPVPLGTADF
jgi:hypothetical protein